MPKVQAIIFDLDGLLIDTESISRPSWRKAATDFGYELTDEIFAQMLGIVLPDLKILLAKNFGEDFPFDEVRKRRIEYGEAHIAEHGIDLKEGVLEFIDYLVQKNLKFGLATSTRKESALK